MVPAVVLCGRWRLQLSIVLFAAALSAAQLGCCRALVLPDSYFNNTVMHHKRAARPCEPEQAVLQHAMLEAARQKHFNWLRCPSFSWMATLPFIITDAKVFWFDIGCNKGYDTALMHEVFQPGGPTRRRIGSLYREMGMEECGTCADCQEPHINHLRDAMHSFKRPQEVITHCFEPSPSNFRRLRSMHSKLAPMFRERWNLHSIAFSNVANQTIRFEAKCKDELCKILGANTTEPSVEVPVSTVDAMAEQLKVQHIHILKIDTEGHDPLVLEGASGLLSRQAVDVLMFEYHGLGPWRTTQLKTVVEDLHAFGYICFFEGRPILTQITSCWVDAYEFHDWSNVVCAAHGTAALKMLASKSFRSLLD